MTNAKDFANNKKKALNSLYDSQDVYIDPGTEFIFKDEKFKFAEICEKKLNYWKLPEASASAEPFLAGCI